MSQMAEKLPISLEIALYIIYNSFKGELEYIIVFYAVIYRDDIESDESFEETSNIEKMKLVVNLVA